MRHVLDALEAKFPEAAAHLDSAQGDVLAFTTFPREIWRQVWSNNQHSTRRSAAAPTWAASSPTAPPLIRLVGAVLAEQNDAWTEARRYIGLDLLAKARLHPIESQPTRPSSRPNSPPSLKEEIIEWPSIHHSRGRDHSSWRQSLDPARC